MKNFILQTIIKILNLMELFLHLLPVCCILRMSDFLFVIIFQMVCMIDFFLIFGALTPHSTLFHWATRATNVVCMMTICIRQGSWWSLLEHSIISIRISSLFQYNTVKPLYAVISIKQSSVLKCQCSWPVMEKFIGIVLLLRGHLSYNATLSLSQIKLLHCVIIWLVEMRVHGE